MTEPRKTYSIIAGINGAGKTSLYSVLKDTAGLGKRVNIDEIVAGWGSWRDTLLQIRAGRKAMTMISGYIERGDSFHQETTLPGATVIKQVRRAKQRGYFVRLFFVGVESTQTAVERVKRRVEQGGHGIDEEVIVKRSRRLPEMLAQLLPLCDSAVFYDNTLKFRQVAVVIDGKIVDIDYDCPGWLVKILNLLPGGTLLPFRRG